MLKDVTHGLSHTRQALYFLSLAWHISAFVSENYKCRSGDLDQAKTTHRAFLKYIL